MFDLVSKHRGNSAIGCLIVISIIVAIVNWGYVSIKEFFVGSESDQIKANIMARSERIESKDPRGWNFIKFGSNIKDVNIAAKKHGLRELERKENINIFNSENYGSDFSCVGYGSRIHGFIKDVRDFGVGLTRVIETNADLFAYINDNKGLSIDELFRDVNDMMDKLESFTYIAYAGKVFFDNDSAIVVRLFDNKVWSISINFEGKYDSIRSQLVNIYDETAFNKDTYRKLPEEYQYLSDASVCNGLGSEGSRGDVWLVGSTLIVLENNWITYEDASFIKKQYDIGRNFLKILDAANTELQQRKQNAQDQKIRQNL